MDWVPWQQCGLLSRWGPIPHISDASMRSPGCNAEGMCRALLTAQICCTAQVEQSSQPKVSPQHAVWTWCPQHPLLHTALWSCTTSSWRHCQNHSHYSNLVIAADPLTVCQTKKKCLMSQAKILGISLLDINTRVTGQLDHWEAKRKTTQKKSKAKQTIFSFQRHLIKKKRFSYKSFLFGLFCFTLFFFISKNGDLVFINFS